MKKEEALKSANYSYYYALIVLKGRFEKGEDIISKHPCYSYFYALDILKGRFEKGEDVISQNVYYSKLYKENIYDAEKDIAEQQKKIKELEKLRNSTTVHYLHGIEL